MSNRQARIARKRAQREGTDVYMHVKPSTGTHPYETREQAKQRRREARKAQEAAAAATGLALRIAPALTSRFLGRSGFGEEKR